jgi:S1-C subfamily serine protease
MEFDPDAFVKLGLTQLNSAIVPVVVIGPGVFRCIGTAFNISPDGVWLTARHVVDEAVEVLAENPNSGIHIIWVGSGVGHDVSVLLGGEIHVKQIAKDDANGSDLALLRAGMQNIETGQPLTFPICRLSARMPKLAQK